MQIAFGRVRRKTSPAKRGRGLVSSGEVGNLASEEGERCVSVVRRGYKPRLLFLEDRAYFGWENCLC